jgi:hypothetical protein
MGVCGADGNGVSVFAKVVVFGDEAVPVVLSPIMSPRERLEML